MTRGAAGAAGAGCAGAANRASQRRNSASFRLVNKRNCCSTASICGSKERGGGGIVFLDRMCVAAGTTAAQNVAVSRILLFT